MVHRAVFSMLRRDEVCLERLSGHMFTSNKTIKKVIMKSFDCKQVLGAHAGFWDRVQLAYRFMIFYIFFLPF